MREHERIRRPLVTGRNLEIAMDLAFDEALAEHVRERANAGRPTRERKASQADQESE